MERKRVGFYNYTVVLTYSGMLFAFMGILQAIHMNYWNAVICLMVAGICDLFDGAIAATRERTKEEKRFGIQIDSLSDLISFGVFPAVLVYMLSGQNPFVGILAAIYVLCALIRLAYYNVQEEERQDQTSERRKCYLGVPVTTIAIFLPLLYLLYDTHVFHRTVWFSVLLLILSIGFLFPVEIKKPHLVLFFH